MDRICRIRNGREQGSSRTGECWGGEVGTRIGFGCVFELVWGLYTLHITGWFVIR